MTFAHNMVNTYANRLPAGMNPRVEFNAHKECYVHSQTCLFSVHKDIISYGKLMKYEHRKIES